MKLFFLVAASMILTASAFAPIPPLPTTKKFHLNPLKASLVELDTTPNKFDIEVTNSKVPVIVDFYANWCGPCKLVSPIFKSLAEEYEDVKFVKVDTGIELTTCSTSLQHNINSTYISYITI